MSSERILKCPRCGCSDALDLLETHYEHGVAGPGVIRIEEDLPGKRGDLIPPGNFWFSAGDIHSIRVACTDCTHEWTPRNRNVGSPHD